MPTKLRHFWLSQNRYAWGSVCLAVYAWHLTHLALSKHLCPKFTVEHFRRLASNMGSVCQQAVYAGNYPAQLAMACEDAA